MSKHMQPTSAPFFPSIFIKNQFRSKTVWPPKETDLTGKVAIVTGSNQGLGLEASDQLLALKLSKLIMAVRSVEKGEAAAQKLRLKYPAASVQVMQLDMASYDSIQAFVAEVEQLERLDIVILNAGIRQTKYETNPNTGHEAMIQVNYISTILLCVLLLPTLKRKSSGGPGRMTIISSGLAFASKFPERTASPLLPAFDKEKGFDASDRYNVTKLAGLMFLEKVADYVSADDVIINNVDPGFVKGTNLTHDLNFVEAGLFQGFSALTARPLNVGASTYVNAAVVQGKDSHGCYLMSWKPHAFPAQMYTTEGKQVTEKLWRETLAELKFANLQEVLDGLKKE